MRKGHRAVVEAVESRQLLASISGLVWNDLNGDKVRDAREEGKWFSLDGKTQATVTLYADLNGNGAYDSTEPSSTAKKDGTYTININGSGPIAVRTHYAINTATQTNTAIFGMVPVVVLASASTTLNNVNVPLEKGGVVTGTFYTDEDADGTRDTNEVRRGKALVFYDDNNNGIRENEEPFVPLTAPLGSTDFKYTIPVPLGEGNLRVVRIFETDTLTIDPVTVTAEAGKTYTRDFRIVPEMVLQGRLFNDLDGNGKRNKGEPYVEGVRVWFDYNQDNLWDKATEPSVTTDAGGNYRLVNRKSAALFGVNVRFRTSPDNTLTSTLNLNRIIFKSIQETQSYNFGFKPASARIRVFNDANGNKKLDAAESVLPNLVVYIDRNKNGIQNSIEFSAKTDASGYVTLPNLEVGKQYTVVVRFSTSTYSVTTPPHPIVLSVSHVVEQKQYLFGLKKK